MDEDIIGKIVISLNKDLTLSLDATGIMSQAHFLSMGSDYLCKYKDIAWGDVWDKDQEDA